MSLNEKNDFLQIYKSVHEEATLIVYRRNTVVLPNAPWTARFFQNSLDSVEKRLWLKDVEVEFCVSDMSLDEWKELETLQSGARNVQRPKAAPSEISCLQIFTTNRHLPYANGDQAALLQSIVDQLPSEFNPAIINIQQKIGYGIYSRSFSISKNRLRNQINTQVR